MGEREVMKDFFTDNLGNVRCTIGNSAKIGYSRFENVANSNDLGNFHKHSHETNYDNFYKKNIDNNYKKIGSKIYETNCPVCNSSVFFCKCLNGGRVFFDDLSPTWSKHHCTDHSYSPKEENGQYFMYPTSIYKNNIVFNKHIPCLGKFKIPTANNNVFKLNIMENTTLLLSCIKDAKYLTILISKGTYKNHTLVKNEIFETLTEILSFIFQVLSQKDLSIDMNINSGRKGFSVFNEDEIMVENKVSQKEKFVHQNLDTSKVTLKKLSSRARRKREREQYKSRQIDKKDHK